MAAVSFSIEFLAFESVAVSFQDLGYPVVCAESGIECLQQLHDMMRKDPKNLEPPVDLILLDVLMPQMDGYETLKNIRQEKRMRNVPVIMITGIDDRANIASFLRAGVDDYVLKPLVLPELQVRLTVCLERRRLLNWVDTLEQSEPNSWNSAEGPPTMQDSRKNAGGDAARPAPRLHSHRGRERCSAGNARDLNRA